MVAGNLRRNLSYSEYFIPDLSNWKNHDAFEDEFARLLKDLRDNNESHDSA